MIYIYIYIPSAPKPTNLSVFFQHFFSSVIQFLTKKHIFSKICVFLMKGNPSFSHTLVS